MSHSKLKLGALLLAVSMLSFVAGTTIAQPRYPDIDSAEGYLNQALNALHAGRDVFGGHKANAIGMINNAIGQLEQGKAFAAAHGF
jgi:hypothetical protein